MFKSLDPSDLADPQAWQIDKDVFRAYTGPFSSLTSIQKHVKGIDTGEPRWRSGDLQVTVGVHRRCTSPPTPVPPAVESSRQVSIQPAEGSFTSCLAWFSVDLFVDAHGNIEAVTLDLDEP